MIRVTDCCAAEALSMLISPVGVLLICVGHAFEWIQQQAAAARFVFCVAMFGGWSGAGYGHVLGLRIRRAVRTVALTVRTRFSERLRHLELCGSALPWVWLCGAALEAASVASVDCLNRDVSEFVDMATVSTQCASVTPRVDVDVPKGKEKVELEKPECRFPVFVRTFSGTRTLYASSSMLVSDFTLLVSQLEYVLPCEV